MSFTAAVTVTKTAQAGTDTVVYALYDNPATDNIDARRIEVILIYPTDPGLSPGDLVTVTAPSVPAAAPEPTVDPVAAAAADPAASLDALGEGAVAATAPPATPPATDWSQPAPAAATPDAGDAPADAAPYADPAAEPVTPATTTEPAPPAAEGAEGAAS